MTPLPEGVVIPPDVIKLAERVGADAERWFHNCHGASLTIVKAEIFPRARVARGHARGVGIGQHSWVALGDPYYPNTEIIDPTLWSYDPSVQRVWRGRLKDGVHHPHGEGVIYNVGKPHNWREGDIALTPREPLGKFATAFLESIGPLDRRGWSELANSPVGGWPAGEIIAAMLDTPELAPFVPIDIAGMTTNRNPGGLYLPGDEVDATLL